MAAGAAELPRKYDELPSKGIPRSMAWAFVVLVSQCLESSLNLTYTVRFDRLWKIVYFDLIFLRSNETGTPNSALAIGISPYSL